LVEQYKDSVTFLHLVGPEPHPITPDTNFDSGKQLMNYWSTVRQPKTYEKRLKLAAKVAEYTHPSATLLIDSISSVSSGQANHGVWCTMGLGARTSMLIGTDGTLQFKQDWFNSGAAADAIETYLELEKSTSR
jgi:hypothetical protein